MNIEDFPLAWRWTQSTYTVLPKDVLKTLTPLSLESAQLLSESVAFSMPESSLKFDASNEELDTVQWLKNLGVTSHQVTISWSKNMALSVPWSTFCKYWNDFCYPSSDDVDIFLENKRLFLRWHHYERFECNLSAL